MMFGSRSGAGFGGAIDYDRDLDGRHDKEARILAAEGVDVYYNTEGQLDADSRQLARSFRAQAMMNPDVRKCVKHLWISYKPEDLPVMVNNALKGTQHFNTLDDAIGTLGRQRVNEITDEAMVEDTKRLLKEMKYDRTQFLIVRHSEKDNPHVHVIINMVDNEGNRLKDFQEKKRGIGICRRITLDRNYTWGEHKSVSETVSNNPKENARAEICRVIFEISGKCRTAEELKIEAERRNIGVRFSTNYRTGQITGISFSKDGFLFPAAKVDASLSANNLFPSQRNTWYAFSDLPLQAQNTVKAGGIVQRFNNHMLHGVEAPELPQSVQESRVRDEYHRTIEQNVEDCSRAAYMQNIACLVLDPRCGPPEKRAEAIAPYIIDEQTDHEADMQRINEIVRLADEHARQEKDLFRRFLAFLYNLMQYSLNLKRYSIVKERGRKNIQWDDLRLSFKGDFVGLANNLHDSIEEHYQSSLIESRNRKAQEAARQLELSRSESSTTQTKRGTHV